MMSMAGGYITSVELVVGVKLKMREIGPGPAGFQSFTWDYVPVVSVPVV